MRAVRVCRRFYGNSDSNIGGTILLIDIVGEMFPLIMLTYDPPEINIMEDPPRNPKDKILTKEVMTEIAFPGLVMGIVAYAAFLYSFLSIPMVLTITKKRSRLHLFQ